jgi:hypothetical protein
MGKLKLGVLGLLVGAAAGVAALYVMRNRLPAGVRARVEETVGEAVEAGRKAAEQRKTQLEARFEELIGSNGAH